MRAIGALPERCVLEVPIERPTSPVWILRTPAMSPSSVDLPTPSGPMSPVIRPAGNGERHVIERDGLAVAMRDAFERGGDGDGAFCGLSVSTSAVIVRQPYLPACSSLGGSLTASLAGHSAAGSVLT